MQKIEKLNGRSLKYLKTDGQGRLLRTPSGEPRDDYSLGLHLINEHNSVEREDFNRHFKKLIVENCSQSNLEKKEHLSINNFECLYPNEPNENKQARLDPQ